MSDILHILYEASAPTFNSPAYQAALPEADAYYQKILRAFSPDFLDGLLTAQAALAAIEGEAHFSRGFRLGAELMLALFPGA